MKTSGLKILFLSPDIPPSTGGGISPWRLAKELTASGHDVSFLRGYNIDYDLSPVYDGFSVFSLAGIKSGICKRYPNKRNNHWFDGIEIIEKGIEKILESFNPQIIHIHHFLGQSYKILEAAEKKGISVIFTFHSYRLFCYREVPFYPQTKEICCNSFNGKNCAECIMDSFYMKNNFIVSNRKIIQEYIAFDRKILKNFQLDKIDRYIAPSCYCKKRIGEDIPAISDKIEVVNLGIPSLPFMKNKSKRNRASFGYVGGNSILKGYYILKDALSLIDVPIELHIWKNIREPVYDYCHNENVTVILHDEYKESDIPAVYSLIDFLIVPSYLEVYPLVCLESLYYKVPVIAFRTGGIPEIINHGINGHLIDVIDSHNLGAGINKIASDSIYQEKLKEGVKYIKIKTISEEASEVLKIYNNVLKAKKTNKVIKSKKNFSVPEKFLKSSVLKEMFNLPEDSASDFLRQYEKASKKENEGDYTTSINMFKELEETIPVTSIKEAEKIYTGILYHIGFNYFKAGLFDDSLSYIDKCLFICPSHEKAREVKKELESSIYKLNK